MPIYTFKCPECGAEKEKRLPIYNRKAIQKCPICDIIMDRLIGAGGGFDLKGKGFYKQGWNS